MYSIKCVGANNLYTNNRHQFVSAERLLLPSICWDFSPAKLLPLPNSSVAFCLLTHDSLEINLTAKEQLTICFLLINYSFLTSNLSANTMNDRITSCYFMLLYGTSWNHWNHLLGCLTILNRFSWIHSLIFFDLHSRMNFGLKSRILKQIFNNFSNEFRWNFIVMSTNVNHLPPTTSCEPENEMSTYRQVHSTHTLCDGLSILSGRRSELSVPHKKL